MNDCNRFVGTREPEPRALAASVRWDADDHGLHSSREILNDITLEEPAPEARAPAFPANGELSFRRSALIGYYA